MNSFAWLAAFFALALASPARADLTPCSGGGTGGSVTCATPRSCTDDAQCFGTDGSRCVRQGSSSTGVCSPNCNPIFRCNSESDCPTFDPLIATCRPTSIAGVPGICEYHDASSRPFLTLCGSGTASLSQFRACFSSAGRWADGDCDGDGTPNGVDAAPCTMTDAGTVPQVASPFCLGGQICQGTSSVCTPFVRCAAGTSECDAVAASAGGTAWECSPLPAAPAVSFCHPSCNATAHCGGTIGCGPLGSCRAVDAMLSMCVAATLATCAGSCSALDWASPQGDCDGDGAQNGCDGNPCVTGSTACLFNHMCTLDAGVTASDASTADANVTRDGGSDASSNQSDAGTDASAIDASTLDASLDATTPRDAARAMDAGGSAVDANADATGQGFGGGGGCRCTAVGARAPMSRGAWLIVLLAIARRRRRVSATC